MGKRHFDYMEFLDGYGYLFDAERYSIQQAKETCLQEYFNVGDNPNLEVTEDYVKWVPNVPLDDRYYLDMPEEGVRGAYMSCDKEDRGSFKCWRVNAV
ncbi:hypothetical protein [Erysipelothrix anatis]|uniref:hypothetical protein n=1 Tax=Erysipelothrix anatis TaxID=2683713 RepID=UPI00135B4616|nr:hypothetical protein [Erysipelothrix anatis]